MDLDEMHASDSVTIAVPADTLYDMVADVSRMGEWSPACAGGRWDDGAGPAVGAWFTGVNRRPDDETYETRNEVVVADRPHELAWVAGGADEGWARWGYRFRPVDGGTEVTESWTMQRFFPGMDDDRARAILDRTRAGIRATLENLRGVAEPG